MFLNINNNLKTTFEVKLPEDVLIILILRKILLNNSICKKLTNYRLIS